MTEDQIKTVMRAVISCSFGMAQVAESATTVRDALRAVVEADDFWQDIQNEIDRAAKAGN